MNTKNEKGSVLLEAVAAIFLCMVFTAGVAALHRSYHRRFEGIWQHRNHEIAKLRKKAEETNTILPDVLSMFIDVWGNEHGK